MQVCSIRYRGAASGALPSVGYVGNIFRGDFSGSRRQGIRFRNRFRDGVVVLEVEVRLEVVLAIRVISSSPDVDRIRYHCFLVGSHIGMYNKSISTIT